MRRRFPLPPSAADPCQGPFATQDSAGLGLWNGAEETTDFIPRLSRNGDDVAFIATAPLVSNAGGFGLGGEALNSDVYWAEMTAPTKVAGLRRLTEFASAETSRISTNGNISDIGISPDGSQVAFTAARTVFPLGEPAYISTPAAVPGLDELYDVDLANETLTRVTRGYEGGSAEHPELEVGDEDRYAHEGDGSLSPSFDASGNSLVFSSTASNLVFGDGNTPPDGLTGVDGADAFLVGRVIFSPEPTPQVISPAPANPEPVPAWRLVASASSLADGAVRIRAELPGSGELTLSAASPLPASSARKGSHRTVKRVVARVARRAGATMTKPVTLELQLSSRYRALAARTARAVGGADDHLHRKRAPDAATEHLGPIPPSAPRGQGEAMRASRCLLVALLVAMLLPAGAGAEGLSDDGGAEWQVEQPLPPPPGEAGVEPSTVPVSLGHIGDLEFYESSPGVYDPDRGALITSGNGGSVKPGVWFYDGAGWRELASQCGATDGRIAWAGPDEFWTISDGRSGQAQGSSTELPPLADNTLCHFAPGPLGNLEIVTSYAAPAFQGDSYQAMHAAACATGDPHECWFGGEPLPAPQVGAFMLHWNGATLEPEPYVPEGREVWDMRSFEGHLIESMRLQSSDKVAKHLLRPPALRELKPVSGVEESPFESVSVGCRSIPNESSPRPSTTFT